jgi:hypothetical protein
MKKSNKYRFFTILKIVAVLVLLAVASYVPAYAANFSVSIQVPAHQFLTPVVKAAVKDTKTLLQQALPSATIRINSRSNADVVIFLSDPNFIGKQLSPLQRSKSRSLHVPDRSYYWKSSPKKGQTVLSLHACSPEGVACGLYGLLQGKLGFRFHHPRESVIPTYSSWPLPKRFTFSGRPRFEKSGFHLHTMHPIELAEQILNPDYPNAFEDVARYIDWLARNGQNMLQFVLLRDIDRDRWPRHAARIVAYAHQRGVICGVQISVSMLQQRAFQSITLFRPYPSYMQQVDNTLEWLFQAPWDFISLEPTMGEHLPFLSRLIPDIQAHLERQVAEKYHSLLLLGTHVIGGAATVRQPQVSSSGILIHSVMCYSVSEAKAPVYGNRNQLFMLQAAQREQARRETWYWPESSYWVGFDTPIPLLLLPYLDARRQDIETMAHLGVNGHLTFTSGWEWGYWLIDWSIARWSWEYRDANHLRPSTSLTPLREILPDPRLHELWKEALRLQNYYLKELDLMRFMAAATPFSELPHPFDKPFQPSPDFHYSRIFKTATHHEAAQLLTGPISELMKYASAMDAVTVKMEAISTMNSLDATPVAIMQNSLTNELIRALSISSLRARHRAITLQALLARINERTNGTLSSATSSQRLSEAELHRIKGLALVKKEESGYRYPVTHLAGKRESITAYSFGYLYPASRLFFWEREEEQIRQGRFDPLFKNLWDLRRTAGVESLFFK